MVEAGDNLQEDNQRLGKKKEMRWVAVKHHCKN